MHNFHRNLVARKRTALLLKSEKVLYYMQRTGFVLTIFLIKMVWYLSTLLSGTIQKDWILVYCVIVTL